jgi:hypothetical protein
MKRTLLLIALAMTLIATPAMAKEGFYLGVNVLFNDFSGDINDLDSGSGLGLRGGYGLNRYLAFEATIFKTNHDVKNGSGTVDFKGGTIDAKLTLPLSGSHIEPYLLGGVGSYKLDGSGISTNGTGGQLGIGMDIYLFPELNFNVGLTRRNITFDSTATTPETKGKVTTLDFGLTYHFI